MRVLQDRISRVRKRKPELVKQGPSPIKLEARQRYMIDLTDLDD